jgi:hypothetical protein
VCGILDETQGHVDILVGSEHPASEDKGSKAVLDVGGGCVVFDSGRDGVGYYVARLRKYERLGE